MKVKIERCKMTKSVIQDIIKIDKDFYLDFDYNDISWYFTRYINKNNITVLKVDNNIVGYYLFYSISKSLFKDICNLKYSGDYDFPEKEVNVESNIYYLPSVLVKKEYRAYSYLLIKALLQEFLQKDTVVAIAISKEGKRMCEKYLTYLGSPKENVWVYKK